MTDPNELIAQSTIICEAATPGPWVFDFGADGIFRKDCDDVDDGVVAALDMYAKDDGEFIATARTLVPELSAALEQATRERDEQRRKVLDLKSQRTLFQNEAIESLHSKVNSLERDAVHHRREHQMVTEEHGKLKRERDEARAELGRTQTWDTPRNAPKNGESLRLWIDECGGFEHPDKFFADFTDGHAVFRCETTRRPCAASLWRYADSAPRPAPVTLARSHAEFEEDDK